MRDLAGKVAFITGGGSGVALGQAKAFAAHGVKVVIADIRRDHLDEALAYLSREQTAGARHPARHHGSQGVCGRGRRGRKGFWCRAAAV